jgi:small subunit ribosomal protein S13
MARIAGVDLPENKRVEIALTYIYGIGRSRSRDILSSTGIDPNKKVRELNDREITELRKEIENYMIEGDLRRKIRSDIQRLKDIKCYRGLRHIVGLPVRGQRTRSNARSWKGPRPSKAGKKR